MCVLKPHLFVILQVFIMFAVVICWGDICLRPLCNGNKYKLISDSIFYKL